MARSDLVEAWRDLRTKARRPADERLAAISFGLSARPSVVAEDVDLVLQQRRFTLDLGLLGSLHPFSFPSPRTTICSVEF